MRTKLRNEFSCCFIIRCLDKNSLSYVCKANSAQSHYCEHFRHPFDSSKWGRICRFLIAEGILDKKAIVEPLEAKREDLLVVLVLFT